MCQLARAPSCNSAPRKWRKQSSCATMPHCSCCCCNVYAAPHMPKPPPHKSYGFYSIATADANANAQVAEWRVPLRGHVQLCSRRGGAAADAAARRAGRRPRSLRRPRRRRSRWPWRRRRRVRTPRPDPRACFNMLYAESALTSCRPCMAACGVAFSPHQEDAAVHAGASERLAGPGRKRGLRHLQAFTVGPSRVQVFPGCWWPWRLRGRPVRQRRWRRLWRPTGGWRWLQRVRALWRSLAICCAISLQRSC